MSKGEKLSHWNANIKSVAFQSGNPELDAQRHYFSAIACQTEVANDQHYIFSPESVPSLIAGYEQGKPILVNHDHWVCRDSVLGIRLPRDTMHRT